MQFMDNIPSLHAQLYPLIEVALSKMDGAYLSQLNAKNNNWLPAYQNIFSAFSEPLANTKYILLGESPYPRAQSANGYAFWDNSVNLLWSKTGLSKEVNRATSLRNMIKMFLYARDDLKHDMSQSAIASLDKSHYLQTLSELFNKFLDNGFLLLNSSLIYSENMVAYHAKHWRVFIDSILQQIFQYNRDITLLLLGKISNQYANYCGINTMIAEHPYNLSFITNPKVNDFFRPFDFIGKCN